jgi:hypothetical protein
MSDEPKRLWDWLKWSWLVLPLTYVCGYFVLCQNSASPTFSSRGYQSKGVAFAYQPLGWLEAKATRRSVGLSYPHPSERNTWCSYNFKPWGHP